jgi:hypothetical protein
VAENKSKGVGHPEIVPRNLVNYAKIIIVRDGMAYEII